MKNFTKQILTSVILITVISFAANAQTNVSGGIYSNTTWTLANSPYIVTDTVVVFPGVTLTIEPGVTVKFDDGKYMEIRQGTLIAAGTVGDSITFTSNSPNPSQGIWQKIYLNYPASAQIDYCIFKYAYYALYGQVPISTLQHLYFYNNAFCFDNSSFGINLIRLSSFYNNGDCSTTASIDSCIYFNNVTGVNYQGTAAGNFTNSIFTGNMSGIILDQKNGNITNCIFRNNQVGIAAGCLCSGITFTVSNSIFCSNFHGYDGDYSQVPGIISNCNFSSNHVACITCSLSGNIFTNNDTAVDDGTLISNNYIYHNHVGIVFNGGTWNASNNYICNNSLYNIIYTLSYNDSFPPTCFCDTDSAAIRSKIYDGYVNISLGLLNFTPFVSCGSSSITSIAPINCQTVVLAGIEDNLNQETGAFEMYPNPSSDNLTVELPLNSSKTEIKIFNMLGELAYSSTVARQKTIIDVSTLTKGMYIIQVATADKISRQKLIRE